MNENAGENIDRLNQLYEHFSLLKLDREKLAARLDDIEIPERERIGEVTIFVRNFFTTVELFKSMIGRTAEDAEEGKIVDKNSAVVNGFKENIDFIKEKLIPFIEKEPENGQPVAEDVMKIMKGRLMEIELLILG